jgi:hypothetical protein
VFEGPTEACIQKADEVLERLAKFGLRDSTALHSVRALADIFISMGWTWVDKNKEQNTSASDVALEPPITSTRNHAVALSRVDLDIEARENGTFCLHIDERHDAYEGHTRLELSLQDLKGIEKLLKRAQEG